MGGKDSYDMLLMMWLWNIQRKAPFGSISQNWGKKQLLFILNFILLGWYWAGLVVLAGIVNVLYDGLLVGQHFWCEHWLGKIQDGSTRYTKHGANPEVSVSENHAQILAPSFGCWFWIESVKKLILISDRLVELRFFVLLFWPIWGLNPRLFRLKVNNGDQYTKWPTDLSGKMPNLDVSVIGTWTTTENATKTTCSPRVWAESDG
jgi:hypothetical protein